MADPRVGLMRRLNAHDAGRRRPEGRSEALRRAMPVALLLVSLFGPGPAGAGGEASGAPPPGLEIRLELLDGRGAQSAAFRPAEPITLRITLGNRGSAPQRLDFSSARTHDAIVRTSSGREVWRWSQGRQFAQMLSELTLAPGESRELSLRWDPSQAVGAAPGEGDYVAVGLIPALGAPIESAPVAFSIRTAE